MHPILALTVTAWISLSLLTSNDAQLRRWLCGFSVGFLLYLSFFASQYQDMENAFHLFSVFICILAGIVSGSTILNYAVVGIDIVIGCALYIIASLYLSDLTPTISFTLLVVFSIVIVVLVIASYSLPKLHDYVLEPLSQALICGLSFSLFVVSLLSSFAKLLDLPRLDLPCSLLFKLVFNVSDDCTGTTSSFSLALVTIVWVGTFLVFLFHRVSVSELRLLFLGYSPVATTTSQTPSTPKHRQPTGPPLLRAVSTPDVLEWNVFDSDYPPSNLRFLVDLVHPVMEALVGCIGFQTDNARNQAEHLVLLMSNTTLADESYSAKSRHLHKKLFFNYHRWCNHLQVVPLFCSEAVLECLRVGSTGSPTSPSFGSGSRIPEECTSELLDLSLLLLIWGEAANLRHMPECLCFLYHKCMEDIESQCLHALSGKSLAPGSFLATVVVPIYDIISQDNMLKKDHEDKRNYDDFNEFFWSRNCLKFSVFKQDDGDRMSINNDNDGNVEESLRVGLSAAKKSYYERRSWFHPIFSFHRVFIWYILSFQVIATIAFSRSLVWPMQYFIVVLSTVLMTVNVCMLLSAQLEYWIAVGGCQLSTDSTARGIIFRMMFRLFVLSLQLGIFANTYSERQDSLNSVNLKSSQLVHQWQSSFWAYIAVSLIALSVDFADAFLQLLPSALTFIYTSPSLFVQSALEHLWSMSLFVHTKALHEQYWHVVVYQSFWISLITFKYLFSYMFEIAPAVLPTIQLFDDYMQKANFDQVQTFLLAVLILCRWIPCFMVFCADMVIFYYIWTFVAGVIKGVERGLGQVRSTDTARSHLALAPTMFHQKILSSQSHSLDEQPILHVNNASNNVQPYQLVHRDSDPQARQQKLSRKPLVSSQSMADIASMLQSRPRPGHVESGTGNDESSMTEVQIDKWDAFATVWNEVIQSMREGDILNNAEMDLLLFRKLEWGTKSVLLPIFQTAGSVEKACNMMLSTHRQIEVESDAGRKKLLSDEFVGDFGRDINMSEAVSEFWELVCWLIERLLGTAHEDDVNSIMDVVKQWSLDENLFTRLKPDGLLMLLENVGKLVTLLKKWIVKRNVIVTADIESRYLDQMKEEMQENDQLKSHKTSSLAVKKKAMKKSASSPTLALLSGMDSTDAVQKILPVAPDNKKPKMKRSQLIPDTLRDSLREALRSVLSSIKSCLETSSDKAIQDVSQRLTFIMTWQCGFFWDDLYASKLLDSLKGDSKTVVASSHLFGLVCVSERKAKPQSIEATRRIYFFLTSLFMDMPSSVPVSDMPGLSTLTPYYMEEVLMTRSELESVNSDNVSTLLYLRTLFRYEWESFLERRKLQDESKIWHPDHQMATRIWASARAQTLFRTSEGMMKYEKALKLLATIENSMSNIPKDVSLVQELVSQKYSYVISCQMYASMKKNQDSKTDDIDFLLFRNPGLRVAYIDEVKHWDSPVNYYSVLIKGNAADKTIHEVYRIKLAGNPILGEGKPENQNHAVIFTRGHFLQTVDMNQDGYLEEAVKVRNLLQEFTDCDPLCPTAILGFREHVFTGSVSSLANFMALQETAFVTIGQRVLDEPLHIRFHYGHPDIFDKLFVMSQGGVSKPCKGLHLSEDIFAGYNATLRGNKCRFVEYTQVGKGRDVGMHQIYKFEAKIAQGNAEQSISRDVNRLGRRLDFFRLLSMYFGSVGFYITTSFILTTLQVLVFTNLLFALFGCEEVGHRAILPESSIQLALCFMGFLNSLPLFATLAIEKGLVTGFFEIFKVFLTGGPIFFLFHLQTRNYYFSQTLLAGGAQYRPTGRGFVMRHSKFDEDYRFFAFSHFYLGFDIVVALVLIAKYTVVGQYGGRMWAFWLIAAAFLFAPFWFNPLTFEWDAVSDDYIVFMQWMKQKGGGSVNSWIEWYKEEVSYYSKLSPSWKASLSFSRCGVYLLISVALLMRGFNEAYLEHHEKMELKIFALLLFIGLLYLLLVVVVARSNRRSRTWIALKKLVQGTAIIFGVVGVVLWLIYHTKSIQLILGLYYLIACFTIFFMIFGFTNEMAVISWMHDMVLAHVLFGILFFFAAIRLPSRIQTWLLFHNALSSGVVIDDVIEHATRSRIGLTEQEAVIQGLQSRIADHEDSLKQLKATGSNSKRITEDGVFESKAHFSAKDAERPPSQFPISAF